MAHGQNTQMRSRLFRIPIGIHNFALNDVWLPVFGNVVVAGEEIVTVGVVEEAISNPHVLETVAAAPAVTH
ncbi:hypothetical protein D3C76_1289890 [compost metagenome]